MRQRIKDFEAGKIPLSFRNIDEGIVESLTITDVRTHQFRA